MNLFQVVKKSNNTIITNLGVNFFVIPNYNGIPNVGIEIKMQKKLFFLFYANRFLKINH